MGVFIWGSTPLRDSGDGATCDMRHEERNWWRRVRNLGELVGFRDF